MFKKKAKANIEEESAKGRRKVFEKLIMDPNNSIKIAWGRVAGWPVDYTNLRVRNFFVYSKGKKVLWIKATVDENDKLVSLSDAPCGGIQVINGDNQHLELELNERELQYLYQVAYNKFYGKLGSNFFRRLFFRD